MPYMKIDTNLSIDNETLQALLARVSSKVSTFLGKPERYVLIHINPGQALSFAGSQEPLAYIELKSIALPSEKTGQLSRELCDFLSDTLSIPPQRIYIEFSDIKRSMWGWNNKTF